MTLINIEKNKIEIIGKITSISSEKTDINGNKFMFFDLMQNEFYKVKLNDDLIRTYKTVKRLSNKIYIVGYLNSYIKDKQNICYIFPKEIKLVDENNKALYGTDYDGVEVFNGVRCETILATEEEQEEMKNMLKEFE